MAKRKKTTRNRAKLYPTSALVRLTHPQHEWLRTRPGSVGGAIRTLIDQAMAQQKFDREFDMAQEAPGAVRNEVSA